MPHKKTDALIDPVCIRVEDRDVFIIISITFPPFSLSRVLSLGPCFLIFPWIAWSCFRFDLFPIFLFSFMFHIINWLYFITIKQYRALVSLTVVMAYHIWLIKGVSHSQDKDHFPIFCPFGIVRYLVILSFTNCQPGMGEQSFHKP